LYFLASDATIQNTIARSLNIDYLYTTDCQMYKGQKTTAEAQVA